MGWWETGGRPEGHLLVGRTPGAACVRGFPSGVSVTLSSNGFY